MKDKVLLLEALRFDWLVIAMVEIKVSSLHLVESIKA